MTDRSKLALDDVPALSALYRLQWEPTQQAHVLLYPEGMVKLSQSAAEILRRVNGIATVSMIIANLEQTYPDAELRADVIEFLNIAYERGWLTAQSR